MSKKRTVIVGLDGIPFHLMKDLSDSGVMPNFKKLREEGIFEEMESSIPEISSVSWSSIITGKNPGEHGIYGFTDLIPGTYTLSFPNYMNLKSKPFWSEEDKKYVILNVPFTFPAQELNGVLISGFVALDLERSLYPQNYLAKLEEINYKTDVDSEKAYKSKSLFLKDLFETLEIRVKTYRYFWDEIDWDFFMFVITGTDRLGHFLWPAYEDKNHKFHKDFIEFFKKTDEIIGEICAKMNEEDSLLMLSDHGMESIKYSVYLNTILSEKGYLKISDKIESKILNYNHLEPETKAFVLEPARIYLNKKGKYPLGSIETKEEEKLLEELTKIFTELEVDGKRVVKQVFRKDELFKGEQTINAPDLILLPNSGFSLRGNLGKKNWLEKIKEDDVLVGKHTQEDAFLYVKSNNEINIPENLNVTHVVDILKQTQK